MSRRLIFLLSLFFAVAVVQGQQLSRYSMPWLDPVQFNPAYAGLDNSLSITGTYRTQWTGLEGQPVGQRLSAHLPVYFLNSGFGVEAEFDEIGARGLNSFGVSWNYQLVRGQSVWSFGVSARLLQLNLNGQLLRTPDGIYEDPNTIIHNDDLLPTGNVSAGTPALGAGIFYQSENFQAGVSARNLNNPVIVFPGIDYELGPQYHAFLQARLDVLSDWELIPLAYAVAAGPQQQFAGGALIRYQENIFAGAIFRGHSDSTTDALVFSGGFNLSEKVTLAYAFDFTLSQLQTVEDGSHEITIKYNLRQRIGAGIPPPRIYHPRVLE